MERNLADIPRKWAARATLGQLLLRALATLLLTSLALASPMSAQDEEPAPEQSVIAPLAEKSLLLDVALADDHLVAVGERGHILLSRDAGATWKQVVVPTRATLTGVWFEGADRGWAVGHDSVILRTTDGGESWERMYWAPEDESPFLDVWFEDAEKGYAVGAYGSLHATTDGGETWDFVEITESDFQPHLNHITSGTDGTVYLAAEAGMAFKSEDGGETWSELTSPYQGSFFGILPMDDGVLLMFGLRGHLYRSEDGGESWTPIETDTTAMLNQGVRLSDGRIVIVGLAGTVLVSKDDGRSFERRPQESRAGIQAVVPAGDGGLVFVGEFGVRNVPLSGLFGE